MGNTCCCKKKNKKKIVLLLVGLDNAGKTVAAKGLAGEATDSVVPTVGFSVVNLTYLNYIVKVFDLGGGANIRGIWHKYFVDAHGVIFVVDSSDIPRLNEARDVLRELLAHEKISGKPVLLLANKQDNEFALDEVEIIEKLDLESIVNNNKCPTLVESCSATERLEKPKIDPGIKKGYDWILSYIVRNYDDLNKRVVADVTQQNLVEAHLRLEKIEKIRVMKEAELCNEQDEDAIESYSNYERKMNGQLRDNGGVVEVGNNDLSEDSSDSFPPVYHIRDEVQLERPKSAVQIVRQHLELNVANKKSSFVSRASNKTVPLHLYGVSMPRSAGHDRRDLSVERRKLKSAGDGNFGVGDLPNVPFVGNGDDFHSEIFQLTTIENGKNLPPIHKVHSKENGVPLGCKPVNGDMNGISIVDVD